MSSSIAKIPLPYVLFGAGLIVWVIVIALMFLFSGPHDPRRLFFVITFISVPSICFTGGIITALRLTGKHWNIGLALNGLGLGILFSFLIYVWVLN